MGFWLNTTGYFWWKHFLITILLFQGTFSRDTALEKIEQKFDKDSVCSASENQILSSQKDLDSPGTIESYEFQHGNDPSQILRNLQSKMVKKNRFLRKDAKHEENLENRKFKALILSTFGIILIVKIFMDRMN